MSTLRDGSPFWFNCRSCGKPLVKPDMTRAEAELKCMVGFCSAKCMKADALEQMDGLPQITVVKTGKRIAYQQRPTAHTLTDH